MSANRTTRRAMLAGAASLPAATIVAGATLATTADHQPRLIASQTFGLSEIGRPLTLSRRDLAPADCSFPNLIDKLLDARERMRVWDEETYPAMSEEVERRFIEETGMTSDQADAMRRSDDNDDAWLALHSIRYRIHYEVDPHENGDSISFRAIRDPQLAIVDEILAKTPRNMSDVLWQLEAALDGEGVSDDSWIGTFAANFRAFAAGGASSGEKERFGEIPRSGQRPRA
jgi:hypothetical protein